MLKCSYIALLVFWHALVQSKSSRKPFHSTYFGATAAPSQLLLWSVSCLTLNYFRLIIWAASVWCDAGEIWFNRNHAVVRNKLNEHWACYWECYRVFSGYHFDFLRRALFLCWWSTQEWLVAFCPNNSIVVRMKNHDARPAFTIS